MSGKPLTDERARDFYATVTEPFEGDPWQSSALLNEFDRWLAAHDARVRVAAIREAAGILVDPVSAAWLRNYADRIEKAE